MINKLVIENLRYRRMRTLLSALVIGVQVMSILTLIGLSRGMLQDSAQRQRGTGADIFLKPESSTASVSLGSGQIPQKFVGLVRTYPHVTQAVGVLTQNVELFTTISGVNIAELEKISGGIRLTEGRLPQAPYDLLVDQYYARQNRVRIGQKLTFFNQPWDVCGVMQGGVLGRLLVQLPSLQQVTANANPPRVTQILVKIDNPARTDEDVNSLNERLQGNLKALSMEAVISQFSISSIPALQAFIAVITGLAVVVGFLVVFLSMYTAVVERTREIGILKALGAKPLTIVNLLVREALVLALVGCAMGVVLSFGAKGIITALRPSSLHVVNVPDWWPRAAAIAVIGALLGAIYPGYKAARQDAIEALAYE